ncbi:MAG: NUDIX domain-containing protein [Gemmatimonadota bacterium]|nr:NUDIX domain-containing protein [Gemmatimonadota bacterium]
MTRGRAQEETSAGGVVYRRDDGSPLFLLIRDSYQNWGFPKGHLEAGERAEEAAMREVREETGIENVALRGTIETIDWYFRFRGRLIHKVCHFFLMETGQASTSPQNAEGITACQWVPYDAARLAISYANARLVLHRAQEMILGGSTDAQLIQLSALTAQLTGSDIDGNEQLGLNLGPTERRTQ